MGSIRHLYPTRAEVLRLSGVMTDGTPTLAWSKVPDIVDFGLNVGGELMCRIDLTFLRPGKDQPMAAVAGRAPDRIGVLMCDATDAIKAGDRVRAISGPVTGTFELRAIPDAALDLATAHHLEVQVVEVAQSMMDFPGSFPTPAGAP